MRSLRLAACVLPLCALISCGAPSSRSSDAGPECPGGVPQSSGGITGEVSCVGINVMDSAAWSLMQESDFAMDPTVGDEIILLDSAGACSDLTEDSFPHDSVYVEIGLFEKDSTGAGTNPTPGTFPVSGSPDKNAVVSFVQLNATCGFQIGANDMDVGGTATEGSVIVSTIDLSSGGSIAGTFNVTIGGDTLSGSFTAPFCSGTISTGMTICR